eukprot:11224306-Alexandrium_andersonii.AAC.1
MPSAPGSHARQHGRSPGPAVKCRAARNPLSSQAALHPPSSILHHSEGGVWAALGGPALRVLAA